MIASQASGQATTGPSGQASAGPINDIDISMYVNATNFSTFRYVTELMLILKVVQTFCHT